MLTVGFIDTVLTALVAWVIWRILSRMAVKRRSRRVAGVEERQAVVRMMLGGKITSAEATRLLNAMGVAQPAGDLLPISSAALASIIGAVVVVVGFMLPWASVSLGDVQGYQAGYNIGFLGWLILALGLLPGLLSSIPALDKHIRQGMFRGVLSATGIAFVLMLMVTTKATMGTGLFVMLVGFGMQFISAVGESGLAGSSSEPPEVVDEMFEDFSTKLREEAARKAREGEEKT
jgi:hypothetical protein